MRIACCGTSSTGKTTLTRALANVEDFRDFDVVTDVARSTLASLRLTTMAELTEYDYLVMQLAIFVRKCGAELESDKLLVDRSFVDLAAHWAELVDERAIALSESVYASCATMARRYDLHVLCPLGAIPIESDGVRSLDPDFHARIESRIVRHLDDWGVAFVQLQTTAVADRVEEVRRVTSGRK